MDESTKHTTRQKDSASKRKKGSVDAPDPSSDEVAQTHASIDEHPFISATFENSPVIQDDSVGILNTACSDITNDQLQLASRHGLRNGRLILKDRTDASKKAAVRSFLEERSKFQWLPACCICNEMRISDGVDVKSESTVPKKGHIYQRYQGHPVCTRCRLEKINVKIKGSSGIHAYSTDANMDPGEVPLVLARLSRVEVLAISRIHMLSQVIQLRYGVYGYRGNSVYLMNNVLDICNVMPRRLDDLSHVWLRLLFPETTFLHHDYIVRRRYVVEAFEFLLNDWSEIPSCRPAGCTLTRNPAYADLSMDSLSQEILDTYPEAGVPDNFLKPITQEEIELVEALIEQVLQAYYLHYYYNSY